MTEQKFDLGVEIWTLRCSGVFLTLSFFLATWLIGRVRVPAYFTGVINVLFVFESPLPLGKREACPVCSRKEWRRENMASHYPVRVDIFLSRFDFGRYLMCSGLFCANGPCCAPSPRRSTADGRVQSVVSRLVLLYSMFVSCVCVIVTGRERSVHSPTCWSHLMFLCLSLSRPPFEKRIFVTVRAKSRFFGTFFFFPSVAKFYRVRTVPTLPCVVPSYLLSKSNDVDCI